jgi:hypothetical protein
MVHDPADVGPRSPWHDCTIAAARAAGKQKDECPGRESFHKLDKLVQERRPDALLFVGGIRATNGVSHAEKLI